MFKLGKQFHLHFLHMAEGSSGFENQPQRVLLY